MHLKNVQIVGNKAEGQISKWLFQEHKARQIFWKTNISYPLTRTRTCVYQGVRNVYFSENLACFVFLKHPFWDSLFCLTTDEICLYFAWKLFQWHVRFNWCNIRYLCSLQYINKRICIIRTYLKVMLNDFNPTLVFHVNNFHFLTIDVDFLYSFPTCS